ncbi:MAG TPA: hypothetical protein VF450_19120, partial [Noviherbaspirillum sp.]
MPLDMFRALVERGTGAPVAQPHGFTTEDLVWTMGSFCALNRQPFDAELLVRQFAPPYNSDSLIHAARALGFRIKRKDCRAAQVSGLNFPCLVVLQEAAPAGQEQGDAPGRARPAIVVQADQDSIV